MDLKTIFIIIGIVATGIIGVAEVYVNITPGDKDNKRVALAKKILTVLKLYNK